MLVLALALLLIVSSATTVVAAPPPAAGNWLADVAAARVLAATEDKPILVDLWATWCTWCKRLEQDVFSTPVFAEYAKGFVLLRVDTEDQREGTRLMEDFGVESLPTTLIVSHDLIKIGELQGYLPAEPYVQSLELETATYRDLLRTFDDLRAKSASKGRAAREAQEGEDPLQTLADELHARRDGKRAAVLYQELLDRGGDNQEELAWNQYYYADSLRLGHDFPAARRAATAARQAATTVDNAELLERNELLSFYLARDASACAEAQQAIDRYLQQHPEGVLVDLAREEQRRLKSSEGCA